MYGVSPVGLFRSDLCPKHHSLTPRPSSLIAWSSVREASHVFLFLEELYEYIDSIAEKSAIFKVDTFGECWVGASGIPTAKADHAVCAAKFAMSKDLVQMQH